MSIGDLLEGREGLRISDPRRTSIEVHAHLRELITSGVLPPGTELKQAELARVFAVSRTPLREAFRMLQEEGLIAGEPNQRSRVLGFDPDELELLYAGRVTLECLGVRLTAGHLSREEERSAVATLREMERTHRAGDTAGWSIAHHRLHRLLIGRSGSAVLRTTASYAEQSERYVRAYQHRYGDAFAERQREHAAILKAVREGRAHHAVELMAHHLSGTALRVMADFAPGRPATAVLAAVDLIAGRHGTESAGETPRRLGELPTDDHHLT
jgi:DNA-binding GntR family transcriptional regulator